MRLLFQPQSLLPSNLASIEEEAFIPDSLLITNPVTVDERNLSFTAPTPIPDDTRQRKPDAYGNIPIRTETHAPAYTDSGYASAPATESRGGGSKQHPDETPAQLAQNLVKRVADDTVTEYSNASSTTLLRKEQYIQKFANDMVRKAGFFNADAKTRGRVWAILPELLRAFALKVGHAAPTQMHRDVMAFVHRHRCEIATAFADIIFDQDDDEAQSRTPVSDGMTVKELMSLWERKEGFGGAICEEYIEGADMEDNDPQAWERESENGEALEGWLLAYQEFVFSTEAYEWLLARMRREFLALRLLPAEPTTIRTIRDKIMSSFPSPHKISRKVSSQSFSATFVLDWDIHEFFEMQGYLDRPDEVFEDVITLTGSSQDAQAATCAQYLNQTWPLAGEVMLELIKGVLLGGKGHLHLCGLSDGTTLRAFISRRKFFVEAVGVAISIAEAGEQLAWLGAALRTSPRESGLVQCTPVIANILQSQVMPRESSNQLSSTDITCEIQFTIEDIPQPLSTANGQCWHGIFRNPVVVKGYPIPQRQEWNTGLEMSLNIMAGLARTKRVDRFNERVCIKGFSTMLVLTKRNEDVNCWHLVYNEDGSRISYLDKRVDQQQDTGCLDLENRRHVLGWCSEAKFYAGSAEAHYPVTHSKLPKPHLGCGLAKTLVSLGRLIMGGPPFSLGAKDNPAHVSRLGYIPRLKWLSKKFVLLWDERDKRGWLINGTSALLHVVRASLAYDSRDKFRSAFLFKDEDLQESPTPFTADSAIDVLINSHNLGLKLYPEKGGHLLLESRIDHFYNVLEKLIDHQADIAGHCGAKLSGQARKYLEGWDFEELATTRDPLYPRVATLEAAGKGWVDLTRAIHAVTLIGCGFGDIIRPSSVNVCEYWAELPKKQYYIASCISDLAEVVKEHGICGDGHVRLSDNLIWHTPTTVFEACRGRGEPEQDHCEPVQTVFPLSLSKELLPRRRPFELQDDGAVIFGHSSHFSWVWGDTGYPLKGELRQAATSYSAVEVDSGSLRDSGIGPSLKFSGSGSSSRSMSSTRRSVTSPSESRRETPDSRASIDNKKYTRGQYTVGILCPLPKELMAVRALFDSKHDSLETAPGDTNHYALGKMAQHMVVAACLPAGEYGTNAAASAACNMVRSFGSLQFCLLVGIAGGVPSEKIDIRLGDVVVSQPAGTCPGVLQYDLGKEEGKSLKLTGTLQRPPRVLTTAIAALRSDPDLGPEPLAPYLRKVASRMPRYSHPGSELDVLFQIACATCRSQNLSGGCSHMQQRIPRPTTEPTIHYGPVASGNRVVKDATFRDQLAREHGVLCFEMEAAGVTNAVNSLVIRGISDYCDVEKNDVWQEYAAAAAAAYAKLLLGVVAKADDTAEQGSIRRSFTERPRRLRSTFDEEEEEQASKRRKVWASV
ncbi:hypothetical protein B0T10DRAFT_409451 [Thelonectria olida]|uniref:Nucleoside phosphorylase domain-containing protein n=1 Tax=Thelonectria olida TaxID=1576542 RepID=A0A9P9AJ10_9HYPO|nr:hypothetical protein B0T10DRAFT_409451 [Thelonectria olida]